MKIKNFSRQSNELQGVVSKVIFMFYVFVICLCSVTFAVESPTPQKLQQLKAELESIIRKGGSFDDQEKAGWFTIENSGGGKNATWPHQYWVVKKHNVYGVFVTKGIKTDQISQFGLPYYKYRSGVDKVYFITDVPAGLVPIVGCAKNSSWADAEKRCKASKGRDCMLNTPPIEMVAFVRMPNKCAQLSSLLHSAYRYSDDFPSQLQKVPIEDITCIVENHRAKKCSALID